ncbi:MAG: MFS transporter [Acidobacteria bacterium]|nr:MAG: MFS transporter [Acidobacteriota bacterium]
MGSSTSPSDRHPAVRWAVLLLVSLVMGANYYAYDALSSIKALLQSELGITSEQYGVIVSFYSVPNTFLLMTVFGGIILDRIGIRRTGLLFNLCCALGVIVTAYGASDTFRAGGPLHGLFGSFLTAYSPELKMMILGRLLFGLGAETSIVVINKTMARWFRERELAFAFAVNLAVARLGTALALQASPRLIHAPWGWTTAIWAAALLMSLGFLAFVVYVVIDRWLTGDEMQRGLLAEDERFRLTDIRDLLTNRAFLYISALCVTFYSAIFPFQAFCPDLLHHKFGLSLEASGDLTSLIVWATILFTPLFGFVVDRVGRRATLMMLGSGILLVSHTLLALTTIPPWLPIFALGIALSLVPAAMWPGVALVVSERRLGTAYGVMTSIQNLGMFAFPILAGRITDLANPGVDPTRGGVLDYTWTVLMFAGLGLVGFVFAVLLHGAARRPEYRALELRARELGGGATG